MSYGYIDAYIKDGAVGLGFEHTDDPAALLPTAQRLNVITCATPGLLCVGGQALDSLTLQPRYTQDLSGNPLPQAPKNKVAANANYTFRLSPGTLTASLSYIWRDEAYTDLFGNELGVVEGYSQTNARLVFREKDDNYQVILFAQNLFDQDVFENAGVARRGNGYLGPQVAQGVTYYKSFGLVLPRVYGIEVIKRFR